jgi:hypothetical protein
MTPHAGREEVRMDSRGDDVESPDAYERIVSALRGLRYGSVTAVVQDGVVVQVDRTEKFRVERREALPRR